MVLFLVVEFSGKIRNRKTVKGVMAWIPNLSLFFIRKLRLLYQNLTLPYSKCICKANFKEQEFPFEFSGKIWDR